MNNQVLATHTTTPPIYIEDDKLHFLFYTGITICANKQITKQVEYIVEIVNHIFKKDHNTGTYFFDTESKQFKNKLIWLMEYDTSIILVWLKIRWLNSECHLHLRESNRTVLYKNIVEFTYVNNIEYCNEMIDLLCICVLYENNIKRTIVI